MVLDCAEIEKKHEALLKSVGTLILMFCDWGAKELLKKAEEDGKLKIRGEDNDPSRSKLVDAVIETIAQDTPYEAVMREVDLLYEINACERKPSESVENYVCFLDAAVARYVNQTMLLTNFGNSKFAILMLRKAKLDSNSLNTVVLQLKTSARSASNKKGKISLTIPEEDATFVIDRLNRASEEHEVNFTAQKIIRGIRDSAERSS